MIANWSYGKCGNEWSVIDAETGERLDKEGIRFADDANGLYYRCLRNERGHRYLIVDPVSKKDEVATELVRRRIILVPRITDTSCP